MKYANTPMPNGIRAKRNRANVHRTFKAAMIPDMTVPLRLQNNATLSPVAFSMSKQSSLNLAEV